MTVTKKKAVLIAYTLKNDKGDVLDRSKPGEPLAYLHGYKNIITGLEEALEGKKVGESVSVSIPPEEAYGTHNAQLVHEVDIKQFEAPEPVKAGMQFQVDTPQGPSIALVTDVKDDKVTVDINHPLVDQALHFDVDIEDVRDATDEELDHGHVHGPGGHQH